MKKKSDELLKVRKITHGNQDPYEIMAKFFVRWVNRRKGYAYLRLK